MSPKKFLNRLGIQNRAGVNHAHHSDSGDCTSNSFDGMAPDPMNLLFKNETGAQETLGRNFKRLENSMRRLSNAPPFRNGPLGRVAELGGGAGIIGMWIASNNLCESCRIYDHALNPLKIGEKWAITLGLPNVSFQQATYDQIGHSSGTRDCDFVFAEHAIELNSYPDVWDGDDESVRQIHAFFLKRYGELASAISNLLKPGAIALIGHGIATPWALNLLCQALRAQELVINWQYTSNRDGLQIYVRQSGSPVLDSSTDEALALVCDALQERQVPVPEVSSQRSLFAAGTTYLELRFKVGEEKGEIVLKQRAGLAALFERGSSGHEAAKIRSAGRLLELARLGLGVVAKTKDCELSYKFVDPRLETIISASS